MRAQTGLMLGVLLLNACAAAGAAQPRGVIPRRAEMKARDTWLQEHLLAAHLAPAEAATGAEVPQEQGWTRRTSPLPFSFIYGGKPSDELLPAWKHSTTSYKLDRDRAGHDLTWTDPTTGLQVRCVEVAYKDYPAVEWTVYFKNTGTENTPILESVQGLDTSLEKSGAGEFVLHAHKGDWDNPEGYEPYDVALPPGSTHQFAPDGGRPTNGPNGWPYYNLQMPGGGLLLAIGWPGEWASAFIRGQANGLRVVAGQQLTHLYLKPGEEIRTPLIAMLFWKGDDPVRAQNLWRRWFLAHNIPRINGEPPKPMGQIQLCVNFPDGEAAMWQQYKRYTDAGIHFDLCWRDAGWYPCGGDWPRTGTWEVDKTRFPQGFRPFSDFIHKQGKKLIVWFEPERVGDPNSWLAKNHPEWLLGGTLLNLGDSAARTWLTDHIDSILTTQGIDYYRQDFNMDPLDFWRRNDAPDRQGITENLYVQGYLAYWDELRRRHPDMLIDSCASGGRRNDLETLRRAVPLLRSDYQFGYGSAVGNQGQTYGISSWIPYYGSGIGVVDTYNMRSFYVLCYGFGGDNMALVKQGYEECAKVAPCMLGDYYPLTPYSLQGDQWIAWQFNQPGHGDGVVQAFRRDKCDQTTLTVRLQGLDPKAHYEVTHFDAPAPASITGQDLMTKGLTITLASRPAAAVFRYQRQKR